MTLDSRRVKELAREEGFSACGLAQAAPVSAERAAELRAWLAAGQNGTMDYLARNVEKRLDPRLLLDGARTVVSLAVNYSPSDGIGGAGTRIARYACGTDYHDVVKNMLRRLLTRLGLDEGTDTRAFVDTAPIDEKYWAQQCGLGWRGRNCQLVIPGAGSFFFLGELLTVHPADKYDTPAVSRCGTCRACLDACPSGALAGDGTMDARRCLSYLTIECREPLPPGTGEKMGGCFYGCDRCAEACPWNRRFARRTAVGELLPRPALVEMGDEDWRHLTQAEYTELFRKSAVKRAKYAGLTRNISAWAEANASVDARVGGGEL